MKKFTKIMSIAAVLLCGLMIMGCDDPDAIKEELTGPKNKWLEKEVEYKKDESSASTKATVYLYYTDDENPTVADLNSDIDLVKGLNIVFLPKKPADETAQTLYKAFKDNLNGDKIPYAVYNFPKDTEVIVSEDESSSANTKKIKMTDAKWTAFCLANPTVKNTATEKVPSKLTDDDAYGKVNVDANEIKQLFSWKKLLIMLLQD